MNKRVWVEPWRLAFNVVRASHRLRSRSLAGLGGWLLGLRRIVVADCETAHREIQAAQERSPRNQKAIGAHCGLPAAFLIASRIRPYVPQRQRLPAIDWSICALDGLGYFLRSAAAVITWPAW